MIACLARCTSRSRTSLLASVLGVLWLGISLASPKATAAGAVDPTFGSGGQIPTADHFVLDVVPTSADGLLVMSCGAQYWDYGCYDWVHFRRFTRDGRLDTAFGNNGVFSLDPGPNQDAWYSATILQRSDGALLVAGAGGGGGFLAAAAANGKPDPVFDGRATLTLFQPARALAVQADGKILVGSALEHVDNCTESGWTLQRRSASGVFDPTFGIDGATTSLAVEGSSGSNCDLAQLWALPGGAIVIQTSSGLRRLHGDGSLDTTFGATNGLTSTKGAVTRTADGRFLSISGQQAAWAVRRYDASGREDPSFGSGGVVNLDLAGAMADFGSVDDFWVNRIAVLEGGDRYVASVQIEGRLKSTGEWSHGTFIVRFLADGRLDVAFGKGGKVQMSRSAILGNAGLFAQSDGRLIVAAGQAIYRLQSDDAPSPGFVIMGLAEPVPVNEGGRARIIVSRTGGVGTAVSVSYQTVAQDALAELDYLPVSGRLSWPAGDDSDRVVELQTIDDTVGERNDGSPEFFVFRIAPADGAPIITSNELWIGIADNDPLPPAPPPPAPPPPAPPPATPGGGSGGGGAIGLAEAIGLFGALLAGLRRRRVMLAVRRRERRRHEGIRHGQFRPVLAQDRLHHLRAELRRGGADGWPPHHQDPG